MARAADKVAAVRGAVAWALGALGDPQARGTLERGTLERGTLERLRADGDPETAEAAREALGKLRAG